MSKYIEKEIEKRRNERCTTDLIQTIKNFFKFGTYIGIPFGAYTAYKVHNIRSPIPLAFSTLSTAVPIVMGLGGLGVIFAIVNCLLTIPERMDYNNLKKHQIKD